MIAGNGRTGTQGLIVLARDRAGQARIPLAQLIRALYYPFSSRRPVRMPIWPNRWMWISSLIRSMDCSRRRGS